MKVITFPKKNRIFSEKKENTIILGWFESMHIGHNELFNNALQYDKNSIISIMNSDDKQENNNLIFSLENRLDILNSIGVKRVLLIEFNEKIRNMEPWDFIDLLVENYHITKIIVGEDYRFGKNAKWNSKNLKDYFQKTTIIPIAKITGKKIGSSLIREMVKTGEIHDLNSVLVRYFSININLNSSLKFMYPENIIKIHSGVYACSVYIENNIYFAIILISFENENEIFFLNFNYEKPLNNIRISFIQEIRIITKKTDSLISEEDKKISKIFLLKFCKANMDDNLIW